MYAMVLMGHAWLRWAVLVAVLLRALLALAGVVRGSSWTSMDRRATTLALVFVDLQLLLGLALYVFLSPLTRAAFADPGAAMKIASQRFYFVEHPFAMILGVALVHGVSVVTRRARTDQRRHLIALVGMALAFGAFLLGQPR